MKSNRPLPQPPAPAIALPSPAVPAAAVALGVPFRLEVLHPTRLPGKGMAQSVFTTAERTPRGMNDYGGFTLVLHQLGVLVTDWESAGEMLVPWSQVLSVEFARPAKPDGSPR